MSHRYQQSYDSGAGGNNYYQVGNSSTTGLNQHTYPASRGAAAMGASRGRKWYQNPWVKWGVPVALVVVIAAAVGGGIAGANSGDDDDASSSGSSGSKGIGSNAAGTGALEGIAVGPVTLNSWSGDPIYSSTASASAPAATATAVSGLCQADNPSYSVSVGNYNVRPDHPRLFGTTSKWNCLPEQIAKDPYLSAWNTTIMGNATAYAAMDPVQYITDGGLSGSGVLDIARELQLRTKHWAYAWRMTNDSSWVERTWTELQVASGNSSQSFGNGTTRWNTQHFLDLAEFTLAFAYSYDWMYDAWTTERREAIMWSIITLGLNNGLNSYTNSEDQASYGWWQSTNGNWNCVCNMGLTLGALAIAGDDPTGVSGEILGHTIPNAQANCAMAVQSDGTWSETSDYWYFGSTAAAEMASGLETATGSDQGLFSQNANYNKTGEFHMAVTGFFQKFNYGDCSPNKYTATANCMMYFGTSFDIPTYTLYQRDRQDAPEPLSMMWYDPDVSGDWWYNLAVDHHFDDPSDDWVAMRGSWTNISLVYAAMKAGNNSGAAHQNHNNLDAGDFVIDALGQRWAGELCQDQYLSTGYFVGDVQDQDRWLYYRCRTEGQNTILMNNQNQNLNGAPSTTYDTTGDVQNSLSFAADSNSAVYWWTDMSVYYNSTVRRGMRLLNERRQILIQDELSSDLTSQWRMNTNATVSISSDGKSANLALNGESMIVQLINSDLTFSSGNASRDAQDPALPSGGVELPNPGVTVLEIEIPSGNQTVAVLFNPQWPGLASSDYLTPSNVALSSWSLTSHTS